MAKRRLAGFAVNTPESAGLDTQTLEDFQKGLKKEASELKSLSGGAHIVLHKGRCVFACADGEADVRSHSRFSLRTICRCHGASKPLMISAFLTLVDAGKCKLSDPVRKYLPFADRVMVSASPAKSSKAKARQRGSKGSKSRASAAAVIPAEATLRDLMINTAGLADIEQPRLIAGLMKGVRNKKIKDLTGLCEAIASKPLHYPPGQRYAYSFSIDMLGRVCEVISGKPLEKFMDEAFLRPLGMRDTYFRVPPGKKRRAAVLYTSKKLSKKQRAKKGTAYSLKPYWHQDEAPGILSGAGGIVSYRDAGIWSTAQDYAKFCQMILAGGVAPNGNRVLKASTAKSFWSDALWSLGGRDGRLLGWHDADGPQTGGWWDYRGLSLAHVYLDLDRPPTKANGKARRSQHMWFSGGGGVYWTIDSKTKLVTVSFVQTLGGREDESDGLGPLAFRIAPYVE